MKKLLGLTILSLLSLQANAALFNEGNSELEDYLITSMDNSGASNGGATPISTTIAATSVALVPFMALEDSGFGNEVIDTENSSEFADALNLSEQEVLDAITALENKGIEPIGKKIILEIELNRN